MPINHVFVLMLENRSFDHMLGLSRREGTDAVTGEPTKLEGLTRAESNRLPSGQEVLPVAFNSLNPEHADCSSVTLDHEGNCDRVRRQGIDEKSTVLRPRSN